MRPELWPIISGLVPILRSNSSSPVTSVVPSLTPAALGGGEQLLDQVGLWSSDLLMRVCYLHLLFSYFVYVGSTELIFRKEALRARHSKFVSTKPRHQEELHVSCDVLYSFEVMRHHAHLDKL